MVRFYGVAPPTVRLVDRAALLERIEQFWTSKSPSHVDFKVMLFRKDARHELLAIEESC